MEDSNEFVVTIKMEVPSDYSLEYWTSQIESTIRHSIYPVAVSAKVTDIAWRGDDAAEPYWRTSLNSTL